MALCSLGLPGSPGMAEPQGGVRVEGRGTGVAASLWPGLAPSASCGPKAGLRLDLDSKSSQATSFWPQDADRGAVEGCVEEDGPLPPHQHFKSSLLNFVPTQPQRPPQNLL